jgi:hypothetical protein
MRFFPFVSLRVRMTVSVVLCLPDPYHGKSNAYFFRRAFAIRDISDIKYFLRAGGKVFGHLMDFGQRKI